MRNQEEVKEVFTVLEAAEYVGVSRAKISQLIRENKLTTLENPLDKRQSLISRSQLDKLRTYPRAPKLKESKD